MKDTDLHKMLDASIKESMIAEARSRFGDVFPLLGRTTHDDDFRVFNIKGLNVIYFHFNTADDSTRIIRRAM